MIAQALDTGGAASTDTVARALGVRVTMVEMPNSLWGLTSSTTDIWINRSLPAGGRRYAIAHELAHVLVLRNTVRWAADDEEWLADWFAREWLLPLQKLAQFVASRPQGGCDLSCLHSLEEASLHFRVPVTVCVLQGMRLGLLPSPWLQGDRLLCRWCGDRRRVSRCECQTYRPLTSHPADGRTKTHISSNCRTPDVSSTFVSRGPHDRHVASADI